MAQFEFVSIQIQFIADPTEQWRDVNGLSVEHSLESVGEHNSKGRLGPQIWEGLWQELEPGVGKYVATFILNTLPAPMFRSYLVRVMITDGVEVSGWVMSDNVRIFGNPGKPSHK